MIQDIAILRQAIQEATITNEAEEAAFYQQFLSKKGAITLLFDQFKDLPLEEKKQIGPQLNALKKQAKEKLAQAKNSHTASQEKQDIDLTLPSFGPQLGGLHPLTIVQNKIIDIFKNIGFSLLDGTEIVSDWYNFEALNFSPNHPAREMQDTFFLQRNPDWLLRSHTTTVQISTCEATPPPIRSIAIGRVFRNEAVSARSHCFFHQIEGLFINHKVSFRDLKEAIYYFIHALFGPDTMIRFRTSYFPFTEPSAEVDISCQLCKGKGCTLCKETGWVEILGSGMVHPKVLSHCKIDANLYSGFAFGMGIERMAMLLYQVDDLRLFSENHLAFLRQFQTAR